MLNSGDNVGILPSLREIGEIYTRPVENIGDSLNEWGEEFADRIESIGDDLLSPFETFLIRVGIGVGGFLLVLIGILIIGFTDLDKNLGGGN